MKKKIINSVVFILVIGVISIGFIYSQTQQPSTTQTLPTVEDLIKKVEENVEKIQDLKADVKEIEQEMNISEKEFSIKQVLKTTEYIFLFKKPDMIKIIPKPAPNIPKTKEELEKFYQQHPEWTEKEKAEYYGKEYLPQVADLISIGHAEYYVKRGTHELTDQMPFGGPMRSGPWSSLLEPRKLHLVHNQLRKLLEPFIMQNSLTVKRDEKNPDVYIIEGIYKGTPMSEREKTSPHGWDYDMWEPRGGDTEIAIKIDYKRGVITQASWHLVNNFQFIGNKIWFPYKFSAIKEIKTKDNTTKDIMTLIEFSNIEINKGIKDEEFSFDNTKGYDIFRYRVKLLNEK